MTYKTVAEYDFNSGAGDEGYISSGEFEILNENFKGRLLELVIEHHDSDEIEESYDNEFYNEYDSYVELYTAVIEGEDPLYYTEKEIFTTLAKEGYINNGLFKTESYYKTKYNDYCLSESVYERVIDSNCEKLYTREELLDNLLERGLIVEVAKNTYSINIDK